MATGELTPKLKELRDEAWQLARESLDEGDSHAYRTLVDMTERLTKLMVSSDTRAGTSDSDIPTTSVGNSTPIFALYKGQKYDAQLDPSRISGGRGRCVLLQGEWMTTSKAATSITGTSVNGWVFWKYYRDGGTIGRIEERRK